jgi:hypothetical protein
VIHNFQSVWRHRSKLGFVPVKGTLPYDKKNKVEEKINNDIPVKKKMGKISIFLYKCSQKKKAQQNEIDGNRVARKSVRVSWLLAYITNSALCLYVCLCARVFDYVISVLYVQTMLTKKLCIPNTYSWPL